MQTQNRIDWRLDNLRRKFFLSCLLAMSTLGHRTSSAEDADRFRPYFKFYDGDVEPLWGVKDHWSLGLGANLDRYLGFEFAFDYYVKDWGQPQVVGQASSYHFVPELRLRYPMLKDRLVPYLLAGIGPSWIQSKDGNPGLPHSDAQGWTYTASIGAGIEYFIQDNVAFGLEGRYNFVNKIDGTIGDRTVPVDLSAALFTFGLRVYFDENHPQPLYSEEDQPSARLYFGVRVGGDFLTDGNLGSGVKLDPEQAAWGGVAGQDGAVLLGVDWGQHFGAEIAGESLNHIIDVHGLGQVSEYGQGWVMANFRLRFPHGRLTPYLYAGPGICYAEVKEKKPPADGLSLSGSTWHPAFNVGAGIEYFITKRFSLNADARWAYSWNHSFEMSNGLSTRGDISYAGVNIGFRVYLFDL
jgi:opacity protein-like surface antigen